MASAETYDVVVYGGTSAGVVAAVQAKRMGKTAIIVEPGKHLGGLTSGGLGWTDSGNKAVIGGISREFYQRVKKYYDDPAAWQHEEAKGYSRYRPKDDAMWTFEPHVAELVYERMVNEQEIPVVREQRLDRKDGVKKEAERIVAITTVSGLTYRGRMFIDATYEGDLMAAAGVSYAVGRENNSQYDESLNGVQRRENIHSHRFVKKIDPYVVSGDSSSGLLPGVHGDPPGEEGQADHRVQAYCYRMCMSNVPRNRVPFPKPAGYEERRYELLLRNFEAGDLRFPMKPDMMPNGKTDTNNNCAFSTDNIGMNYDYPEASYKRRAEILREHETYQKGLMWTLANHRRVPEEIRQKMSAWGLPKDEFTDNGNWPHQIYVREARRMVSDYVATESDCRRVRVAEDSVGMGSYNMDSHNVQRYVTAEGYVQNEGDVQVSPGGAYVIGYRSIVPKQGECENLLVPVCLSSSHIAYGSIRMEPVFMVLGQSAATAAVLAIDDAVSVQNVAYTKLRERLLADKQALEWKGPAPRSVTRLNPKDLPGIVLDDESMERIGVWLPSASVGGFVGSRYWHDNNESQGEKSIRFKHRIKQAGEYEIRLSYTANPNRATNVLVEVQYGDQTKSVRVNQRKTPPIDEAFISLGKFSLSESSDFLVTISNANATGHVIADAVQLLPTR
ncbi:MAG: FAD-dependent oxidoreductase [Planctomycetaceae bacterium]|nr:FAD-dependent oxidoreductase [Planctomycetaceae bacterium]